MKLSDMISYDKNGRYHEKNVPAIMESIKQFGFRGVIMLQSAENPVIVCGHGRVEALKRLGWKELGDEHIIFADGMSEDEIKAYRIADNKTCMMAPYNPTTIKNEVAKIKTVDMSRFGCNFKSKSLSYGAERLRVDDAYNLRLVNAEHCDENGMPRLQGVDTCPAHLLAFNYALTASKDDEGSFLHFFIDDYQFERLWRSPEKYLEVIKRFAGVLSPDFSCYMDMPLPMQRWNEYRRRTLANFWQRNGIEVIPTLSWADARSFSFAFDGLPQNATVAVSSVGCKGEAAMQIWREGMAYAMNALHPKRVLLYGGKIDFDFGNTEVKEYEANTAFKGGA